MSYRSDVEALAAREAALALEVKEKTRELAAAARLLEEARAHASLPILDSIRVATPCHASWEAMTGDERARLCGACNRHVYNISGLTREEAEELIIDKEGELCVRYFQRADGTILLADCEVGKRQKRKLRLLAAGAATLASGVGFIGYERTRPEKIERVQDTAVEVIKLDAVPAPPPPTIREPVQVHQGVPAPTAEERLLYQQLKKQSKAKRGRTR